MLTSLCLSSAGRTCTLKSLVLPARTLLRTQPGGGASLRRNSKLFSNNVVTWVANLRTVLLPATLLELQSSGSLAQR